jgi:autotransporter-associated beta strand protein
MSARKCGKLALIVLVTAGATGARALEYGWNGGGASDAWSDAGNWTNGAAPGSINTDTLVFFGSDRLTNSVDVNNPWVLRTITFTNLGRAVLLTGNTLRFDNTGVMLDLRGGQSVTISNAVEIAGGRGTRTVNQGGTGGALLTLAGPVSIEAGSSLWGRGGSTLVISGPVSGAGAVTRTDPGTLRLLNPTNSFTGNIGAAHGVIEVETIGNAGVPSHAGAGAFVSLGQGTWGPSDTGTLRYTGASGSTDREIRMVSNVQTQLSSTLPFSGRPTLDITNAASTLTFNGNFVYDGVSTLGMWRVTGAGNGVINGDIRTRSARFEKTGTGTWTINGGNSLTNLTEVKAGTLVVNGTHTNAGTYSVSGGATLGGSGLIQLADGSGVSILGGGHLSPGTSAGTLTITNGGLTFAPTSILDFELSATDTTVGGGVNDHIALFGPLVLDGVLNLSGSGDFTAAPYNSTWTLIQFTGGLTDNTLSLGTAPDPGTGRSWQIAADTDRVTLSIVPEPGTALLGLVGLLVLALRRRP